MDWGSWHCTGDRDQDHPHGREMQKSKMAFWGGLTKDLQSMAQFTDPICPRASPSHQEASSSLLSIRRQTEWKSQSQNTNQNNHMDQALSNSMKLWPMAYRATQDGQAVVECSDKTWSTGEGDGKLLCIFAFRTPWTPWKDKKIRQWKMNSPGW